MSSGVCTLEVSTHNVQLMPTHLQLYFTSAWFTSIFTNTFSSCSVFPSTKLHRKSDSSCPFLYSLLVYWPLFWLFFLSIITRPKNILEKTKNKEKQQQSHQFVCVYAWGLTLRLKVPKQVQVSSIITKSWDKNWLSEPCLCMSNPHLNASQYSRSSALWSS